MKTPGASYLTLRYAIALAMSTASFVPLDRAEAACDPATSSANPIINTTVNCTGTTTNQNGTAGYGTTSDIGNTYNILSGASVTGTNIGLGFLKLGTVNNFGTIAGANTAGLQFFGSGTVNNFETITGLFHGILGALGTVNNAGVISATDPNGSGIGVSLTAASAVTNSGSIFGTRIGIGLNDGEVTNTETGTITGGSMALKSPLSPKCRTPARSRAEYVASAFSPAAATSKSPTAAPSRAG